MTGESYPELLLNSLYSMLESCAHENILIKQTAVTGLTVISSAFQYRYTNLLPQRNILTANTQMSIRRMHIIVNSSVFGIFRPFFYCLLVAPGYILSFTNHKSIFKAVRFINNMILLALMHFISALWQHGFVLPIKGLWSIN